MRASQVILRLTRWKSGGGVHTIQLGLTEVLEDAVFIRAFAVLQLGWAQWKVSIKFMAVG